MLARAETRTIRARLAAPSAMRARLESLKAARYGTSNLVLLAWAESTGSNRTATSQYFTMVVDREGAVCQPKTPLAAELAFTSGHDFVRRSDSSIVGATLQGSIVSLVTLDSRLRAPTPVRTEGARHGCRGPTSWF